jgi:hypothetical protein
MRMKRRRSSSYAPGAPGGAEERRRKRRRSSSCAPHRRSSWSSGGEEEEVELERRELRMARGDYGGRRTAEAYGGGRLGTARDGLVVFGTDVILI